MSTTQDSRAALVDILMRQVTDREHLSPTMLDRIEMSIGDRQQAERYVEALIDRLDGADHPSTELIARVQGLLDVLERSG